MKSRPDDGPDGLAPADPAGRHRAQHEKRDRRHGTEPPRGGLLIAPGGDEPAQQLHRRGCEERVPEEHQQEPQVQVPVQPAFERGSHAGSQEVGERDVATVVEAGDQPQCRRVEQHERRRQRHAHRRQPAPEGEPGPVFRGEHRGEKTRDDEEGLHPEEAGGPRYPVEDGVVPERGHVDEDADQHDDTAQRVQVVVAHARGGCSRGGYCLPLPHESLPSRFRPTDTRFPGAG